MTAPKLADPQPHRVEDLTALSFADRDRADRLRLLRRQAAHCRSAAHLDLHRACSLLTLDRAKAPVVFARSLLRTLGQALGKRPLILHPNCPETSFDEDWLLQMIDRLEAGDTDSFTFLLSRRIPHQYRRSVAFLLHGLITPPDAALRR